MGKHHQFEALLQTEFRWPKRDDVAFQAAKEPSHNAHIAERPAARLFEMTEGYKLAADALVERALEVVDERDFLVCPIIFSYRQYVELSLKSQLLSFGAAVAIKPKWDTHRLEILWTRFREMLDRYGTIDPDDADKYVASVISEFAKIDPGSFSHRYPVDRNGNALPLSVEALDLRQLRDVMNGVAGYFLGCDGYLSDLKDEGP